MGVGPGKGKKSQVLDQMVVWLCLGGYKWVMLVSVRRGVEWSEWERSPERRDSGLGPGSRGRRWRVWGRKGLIWIRIL